MSKEFFNSWKTWEKLVFILACAIVVTVLLGCIKLIHTHWRLRKYAAVEKERKEQTVHRQMSQRRNSCRRVGSDTVPFGVRALESGIEIEGVWISPANTPETASHHSSPLLSPWATLSKEDHLLRPEKQQLPQLGESVRSDLAAMKQQIDVNRDRTSETHIAKPTRSRHPPSSYTKYQGNPYILRRQSSATSTLQGLEAIHRASTSIHAQSGGSAESTSSSCQSSNSGVDVAPISASAPYLLTGESTLKLIQSSSSTNLELLDSHRMSQAAETGQLTPRGRGSSKAYSWDSSTHSARTSVSVERPSGVEEQHTSDSNSQEAYLSGHLVCNPSLDSLPPALRSTSMPDVIPFTRFCKMAPPSPSLGSKGSNSMESVHTITSKSEEPADDEDSRPSSPIIPASEGAESLKLSPPLKRGSFEKHIPQIVRGHGSGFEILKPGSFNPPPPKDCETVIQKKWNCPPLSLQNASHLRAGSAESQKKLQNKQRFSLALSSSLKADRRSQGV